MGVAFTCCGLGACSSWHWLARGQQLLVVQPSLSSHMLCMLAGTLPACNGFVLQALLLPHVSQCFLLFYTQHCLSMLTALSASAPTAVLLCSLRYTCLYALIGLPLRPTPILPYLTLSIVAEPPTNVTHKSAVLAASGSGSDSSSSSSGFSGWLARNTAHFSGYLVSFLVVSALALGISYYCWPKATKKCLGTCCFGCLRCCHLAYSVKMRHTLGYLACKPLI